MVAWDGLSYYCKERPMRSRTNLLVSRSSTRCRPPRRELYVACQLKGTSSTVLQHAHIMPLRSRAFARQKLCLDLYVSLHSRTLILYLPIVVRAWDYRSLEQDH